VRRRSRVPADPEVAEALTVLDRYRAMLEALREAGDPYARWRLHVLWWARHDIEESGLDFLDRLRVKGYRREVERLTATAPEVLRPGTYRGPANAS
jgi:hypothetical protein